MDARWTHWTRLDTGRPHDEFHPVAAFPQRDGQVVTLCADPGGTVHGFTWSDGVEPEPTSTAVLWHTPEMRALHLVNRYQTGTLDAFGIDTSTRQPWVRRQRSDQSWPDEWTQLSFMAVEPVAFVTAANGLGPAQSSPAGAELPPVYLVNLFIVTETGHIWNVQESTEAEWSAPAVQELFSEANRLTMLSAVTHDDMRMHLIGIGPDHRIWRTCEVEPGGPWTGQWSELYTDQNRLTWVSAAINAEGRLEVFGVAPSGRLWHTWELEPGGGWNGDWVEFRTDGHPIEQLAVFRRQDGRLSLFGFPGGLFRQDGIVWHTWQTNDHGHWNGAWVAPPKSAIPVGVVAVTPNEHSSFDAFAIDDDGGVWRSRQRWS
jgi:hypothetical protein